MALIYRPSYINGMNVHMLCGNGIFSHVSRPFCMCKNMHEETNVCCAIALNQGMNVHAISTALASALLQ